MKMDKYDLMILDIIQSYKLDNQSHIRLSVLERNFWKCSLEKVVSKNVFLPKAVSRCAQGMYVPQKSPFVDMF